jgi:hypothetical protein
MPVAKSLEARQGRPARSSPTVRRAVHGFASHAQIDEGKPARQKGVDEALRSPRDPVLRT